MKRKKAVGKRLARLRLFPPIGPRAADLSASIGRPFNRGKIAGAVKDAHNLRSILRHAIERQPAVDDKRPRIGRDVRARRAELRVLFQARAILFDPVEDGVSDGPGVPARNA